MDEITGKAEKIGGFGFVILEAAVAVEKYVEENGSDDVDKVDNVDRPSSISEPEDVLEWALSNAEDGVISTEDLDRERSSIT